MGSERRRLALTLSGLLGLLGCGEPSDPPSPQPPGAPSASAPAMPSAAEGPRLRVSRAPDGSLRVVARDAPRFRVLQELARSAGFAVAAGVGRAPARNLDLDLEGASVEEVLEHVLGDVPHHLAYAARSADRDEVVLRRVTIGLLAGGAGRSEADRSAAREPRARPSPVEPAARETQREGKGPASSREPSERARATAELRPDSDFAELEELLASDPDPEVRASAAASLAEVDGGEIAFRAGEALLAATLDPDPAVAAAAIRALEDVHDLLPDPRFRARIAALADHRDRRVREAAASFLEWTEDDG